VPLPANATGPSVSFIRISFLYFFYHDFAKIYDPPEILQNYTSIAVAHGVKNITSWPTAVEEIKIKKKKTETILPVGGDCLP
jgi:hypothetical protein